MRYFVREDSIVRKIWGDADVILLIFAGGAAEFAVNRAVDWLFFTGKLPADPIGRLFSTVKYAQEIVFMPYEKAVGAINRMRAIHGGVEKSRGAQIPDWAYRDVLYMLMDYSERAFELLHRPLTAPEREEVFDTFRRVGEGMGVPDLPRTYAEWQVDRQVHLDRDLVHSPFTEKLFMRYREELGNWRYGLLLQAQSLLVPEAVSSRLNLPNRPLLASMMWLYKVLLRLRLRAITQQILLPNEYLQQVRALDQKKGRGGSSARPTGVLSEHN
ncbi:oxygenase MpaB family protein [Larkinella insperata]|uniref:Oxygenase MpaB family protein n=1 Tax=Larkinella insperata TaxID=332158 RepID=A0ABW3QFK9_9BACT|nr:oxygenase MpaB family protein [Larkinella insperata]